MTFNTLGLSDSLLHAVQKTGYTKPTLIQEKAIPVILSGKDVMAAAQTGTGKTAGFTLPLLQLLSGQRNTKDLSIRALVLTPTRELAAQVQASIDTYGSNENLRSNVVFGGVNINPQKRFLRRGLDILVATPGRLLDLYQQKSVKFDDVEILILDEADRMLDMGFLEDILRIIDMTPRKRQTLLFSATFADEIKAISKNIQQDPVDIRVETLHDNKIINQVFYEIQSDQRSKTLVAVLQHYQPESSIVFCNRKQQCQELADELIQSGFHALALHGDLEQFERDQVLVQFSNKSSSILIATDVAARGLDIKDLEAVINYELTPDPEIHIHRIGRTGRAGKEGLAISLFTASEQFRLKAIEDFQNSPVRIEQTTSLEARKNSKLCPPMVTLCINGGRKEKLRAGDILGALTANTDLPGKKIGKINIFDKLAYVAVDQSIARQALKILSEGKIKGRMFKVRKAG